MFFCLKYGQFDLSQFYLLPINASIALVRQKAGIVPSPLGLFAFNSRSFPSAVALQGFQTFSISPLSVAMKIHFLVLAIAAYIDTAIVAHLGTTGVSFGVIADGQPYATATGSSCPAASSVPPSIQNEESAWSGWGGNIYNNRWASSNSNVTAAKAVSLTAKCTIEYSGGVSATPVIVDNIVYYPTWGGLFVALDYTTCKPAWEFNVTNYIYNYAVPTLFQASFIHAASRTSPAFHGDVLYIGTLTHALLVALNRTTGTVLAHLQINTHPFAVLTTSPTVYNGTIFIGGSSQEENAATGVPNYQCCSFVGNMVAATFSQSSNSFTTLWNVSMLPLETSGLGGWAGSAVWGSQPSIDASRSQLFIATGNVYTTPPVFEACREQTANISVVAQGLVPDPCTPPDVYQESVIAFDLTTGLVNWVRHLSPLDSWITACGTSGSFQYPNQTRDVSLCPEKPGVDADIGMMPTFIPGSTHTPYGRDTLVVGQKNGNLFALSAQAGTVFWATSTSPDGDLGGLIWGVAVDESRVYFTAVNSDLVTWNLQPSNETISNSAFGAANLTSGEILWETASPGGSVSLAVPTVVNDVVFFSRVGNGTEVAELLDRTPGGLLPVDKATGNILRDYELGSNMHGGVAVVEGWVMFGTGYQIANGTGQFNVWSV